MQTIGNRILIKRKENKISRESLGLKIGVSKTAIKKWEDDDNTPKHENLVALSRQFRCSIDYLVDGVASDIRKVEVRQVPVLNYVQAGKWRNYFDDAIADQFEPVVGDFGDFAYGLIVEGDSMLKEFSDRDIIIVDPDKQAKAGDYVVALINTNQGKAATFKKYRPRGFYRENKEYFELVALNEDYESYDSRFVDCEIVAVAVEHKRKL